MREKIRTPGLLIRSQTLYPAELSTHALFVISLPNDLYITTFSLKCQQLFSIFFPLFFICNILHIFPFICITLFTSSHLAASLLQSKSYPQPPVLPHNQELNNYKGFVPLINTVVAIRNSHFLSPFLYCNIFLSYLRFTISIRV